MFRGLQRLLRILSIGLVVTALVRELRMPPEQRTWHGRVGGVVPYEFRPPTLERAIDRLWNPDDPRLLMPTLFGVGWTLNFGRLVRLARAASRE